MIFDIPIFGLIGLLRKTRFSRKKTATQVAWEKKHRGLIGLLRETRFSRKKTSANFRALCFY